jgi:hypothetical protein
MTDTIPETVGPDTEAEGWGEDSAVTYPEMPANPHNHRFTISMDGRGPMIVVRGNTAEEVNAGFQELEVAATGAVMGNAWASIKAAAMLANGVGPVSPVGPPQGAPAPVQPMPLPQAPQAQYPAGPPVPNQGQAPAQWQNAGAPPQQAGPQNQEYRNAGWYRLDVPFPKKQQFDGIVAQYGMQKGRPSEGGSYSFNSKGEKAWYVSPQFASIFPMFSPVPA